MTGIQLIERLDDSYQGSPWFGSNLLEILAGVERPNFKMDSGNSIGQILEHIIAWRIFAIKKLELNETYDIELNSLIDWNKGKEYTTEEFNSLVNQMKETQTIIKALLIDKSEDWLNQITLGRKYSLSYLIEGIIQHDIYHFGQIGILKSQSETKF